MALSGSCIANNLAVHFNMSIWGEAMNVFFIEMGGREHKYTILGLVCKVAKVCNGCIELKKHKTSAIGLEGWMQKFTFYLSLGCYAAD